MALVPMHDKIAIMPQADAVVTINGQTFTIPAATPFTTSLHELDIAAGTVLAVMTSAKAENGKPIQVFSVDAIMTVA